MKSCACDRRAAWIDRNIWPGLGAALKRGLSHLGFHASSRPTVRFNPDRMLMTFPDGPVRGQRIAVTRRVSWPGRRTTGYFPFSAYGAAGGSGVTNIPSLDLATVQSYFNNLATDDVQFNLPAGSQSWGGKATLNLPAGIGNFAVMGAGDLSVVGGNNATVITDTWTNVFESLWDVLQNDGNRPLVIRVGGVTLRTFDASTTYKSQGFIKFVGVGQFRADHTTFDMNGATMWAMHVHLAHGVADHNVVQNVGGQPNGGLVFTHYAGALSIQDSEGDGPWAQPTSFGSEHFYFVENNTLNSNIMDCDHGARVVARHNTINDASGLSTHGTGQEDDRARGCRAQEVYNNTFVGATGFRNAVFITAGPGLVWGNTVPAGFTWFIRLYNARHSNGADAQGTTPNSWGNCGSNQANGVASGWDGNSPSSAIGYPCLDQPGRGQGQMIVNAFPNAVNQATGTIAWPNQALEPIYEWGNTLPISAYAPFEGETMQENRDYYAYTGSFTGSAGVGSGTGAPTMNCTPGVAYWRTDTSQLYRCGPSANQWTVVYVPYTYPHPLVGGVPSNGPPAVPTGVAVVEV